MIHILFLRFTKVKNGHEKRPNVIKVSQPCQSTPLIFYVIKTQLERVPFVSIHKKDACTFTQSGTYTIERTTLKLIKILNEMLYQISTWIGYFVMGAFTINMLNVDKMITKAIFVVYKISIQLYINKLFIVVFSGSSLHS